MNRLVALIVLVASLTHAVPMGARAVAWTRTQGGEPPPAYGGLCFTAVENNSSVALVKKGSAPAVTLVKSFDGVNWEPYTVGEAIELSNKGDFVYFAAGTGGNATFASSTSAYHSFVLTGKVSASGDITSISDFNLSHSALANSCYRYMFYGCAGLTSAPELPATTLATSCYSDMFRGCTGLTSAPELPATALANSCYRYMFYGCTSLTSAPELPATALIGFCYSFMFYGCTGLTSAPELPATTLATSCYASMFYGCTSLTSAPELPATKLANNCYQYMFYRCTSLKSIKVHFSAWGTQNTSWVSGVPAGGTFFKPSALPESYGTSKIPSDWTVVNID